MTFSAGGTFDFVCSKQLEFIMPHRRPASSLGIPAHENLELLKASLSKSFPVPKMARLDDLLIAIDEADEEIGKRPTDYYPDTPGRRT